MRMVWGIKFMKFLRGCTVTDVRKRGMVNVLGYQ